MINPEEITNIQFGVSLSNQSEFRFVPVDVNVQGTLKEILISTQNRVNAGIVGLREYEPSEKYATRETLYISLLDEHLEYLQNLYANTSIPVNSQPIENYISQIDFYFVFYTLRNNAKILGVKRSTQFKSLLKSRMIRLIDDTLKNVEDTILKLDDEFDYYVYNDNVYINLPTGFQYTTQIEEFVQERAFEATNNLVVRVPFIKFTSLASFVKDSKTCAKLIASIKKRTDLEQIDRKKLIAFCKKLKIQIKINDDDSIEPEFEDKYQDFLMVLDRRLFEYNLISNIRELYEAPSRIQKPN
jgi:hypothetical protein